MHKIFIYETNQCLMLKTNYQKPTTKPQFRKMLENNLKRGKKFKIEIQRKTERNK